MTDKEYKKQSKRVERLFHKWVGPLGLKWWEISLHCVRERKTGDTSSYAPPDIDGFFTCIFDVHCDYFYKTADINAYIPIVEGIEDEANLERYFLHELMHILVRPMKHKQKAGEEEQVATMLADAFLWVAKAAKDKKL